MEVMFEIVFWDREKEIRDIMAILNSRPDLITFVYGPINSGKTELFQHVIDGLSNNFVVFYINLREKMIKNYNDFIEALFEVETKNMRRKRIVKDILLEVTKFYGVPISKSLLNAMFKDENPKDAFKYIVDTIRKVQELGKISVFIVDELQKIGDVKIDDYLIYELFNLFIRLTKELHACHVFAVTSDSLFLEKVYEEAMLHGRCRYLLVDDFDYDTAVGFLKKYGFKKEEIDLVWKYFGGKPVYLVEAIKVKVRNDDLRRFCDEMLQIRKNQIRLLLNDVKRGKSDVELGDVMSVLRSFEKREIIEEFEMTDAVEFLIRNNVLFFDPVKGILRPQSRLDLLAVRSVLTDEA